MKHHHYYHHLLLIFLLLLYFIVIVSSIWCSSIGRDSNNVCGKVDSNHNDICGSSCNNHSYDKSDEKVFKSMLDTYNPTKSCTTCVDDIHYNDFIGTYNSYSHGYNQNYSNSSCNDE